MSCENTIRPVCIGHSLPRQMERKMAQIYDRFQIENSHCLSQHIVDTALTRFSEALNRTVVTNNSLEDRTR